MKKSEELKDKASFWDNPTVVKAKGVAKIGFGALILLQPHYAFLIGGALCASTIAAITYNKI
ncbi:MAG: hypothetical protein AABY27_00085, partial [Pseudomonadota bacterium]